MTNDVTISREGAVQVLRFTRAAKKNALTSAMYAALADALEAGDRDPAVAAHVWLGSDGVFTSGNDIKDFLASAAAGGHFGAEIVRFVRALPQIRKPMVAGVDGLAIGIGTTMLFHCDLIYASPGAMFATPFVDLALVPEAGSSLLMPQRLGYARAFEMLGLGATAPAERMLAAGLINAIVPSEDVDAVALGAAKALAKKPRAALETTRRLMRGDPAELLKRIDVEAAAFQAQLATPEARAAFEGFLAKSRG